MKLRKSITLLLLAASLTMCFAIPSFAASPHIQSNVSKTEVSANLSNKSLPADAGTLTSGNSYYFNFATDTTNMFKSCWLYIKMPGASDYSCAYSYTANNYFRYTSKKLKVSGSGTLQYYWKAKYTNGDVDKFKVNTRTVKGKTSNDTYSESTVKITKSPQTVDTFNGVSARYLPGTGNTNTGTYCCAGLVKAYYSNIYGIDVYNLLSGCTPKTSSGKFVKVSEPKVGDICYHTNSEGSGHWMIVKAVNGDGSVTVFEQNYKWKSNGATYCYKNRHVSSNGTNGSHKVANLKFFRFSK